MSLERRIGFALLSPASGFRKVVEVLRGDGAAGQLARGVTGTIALKVSQAALGLGVAVLLARALGPQGYGVYAFALSLVTLLAIPAQMGLPTLVVREVAKYHLKQDWGLLRGLLRGANVGVLGLSVVLALVAGGVAWALAGQAAESQLTTLAWAFALLPLLALGNLRGAALRGLQHVVQGQLPEMLLRPGLLLLLAGGAVLGSALTPPTAMALHVLAAAIAFVIGAVLLLRALPGATYTAAASYETAAWTRSVLALSFLAGMQVINSQTDIVMLGLLTTSGEVGIYRVAVQGAHLVTFTLGAVSMVIAPNISRLYNAGDMAGLQRMVTWSARIILLAALPVAGTFIVFGEPILALIFGEAYRSGHTALAILCLGQLINAGTGSVGLLLNMTGHEGETAKGVAIAAVANVVLNLLLIPIFGIEGAATSTAVTLAIWNLLLSRQVWRRLGIESTAIGFHRARVKP